MDVLSDVLTGLRLRGTVYFTAEFRAPWGMDVKGGEFANFHIVRQGECWVGWEGLEEPLALAAGDLVVFPHGHRHALTHAPRAPVRPAAEVLAHASAPGTPMTFGGDGPGTTLICGHFAYDRAARHPFMAALPEVIHLRGEDAGSSAWMQAVAALGAAESGAGGQGARAVVDRLAEALLAQVLRAHLATLDAPAGFLAALADREICIALSLLHGDPAREWRMEDLARAAGVSRSVLAQRFRRSVGTTPMDYLGRWRMQISGDLLRARPELSIAQVAEKVGYRSEWAFAKAFKRRYGRGPGAYRR